MDSVIGLLVIFGVAFIAVLYEKVTGKSGDEVINVFTFTIGVAVVGLVLFFIVASFL